MRRGREGGREEGREGGRESGEGEEWEVEGYMGEEGQEGGRGREREEEQRNPLSVSPTS